MKNEWWMAWRPAVMWGLKIALAQRVVLLIWMAFAWVAIGQPRGIPVDLHVDPIAKLPTLTAFEQATVGVWRRWDASHYLNLAQNGYRPDDPGPTVFGPLTPLAIRAFDILLPGGIDWGGAVFGFLAFALVLILLYRVCETYYGDAQLGKWAVVFLAISPLAFFYDAPMSEAIYLALALAFFYAGTKGQWKWAALWGMLATLARSQGVLLVGVGLLILWEQSEQKASTTQRLVWMARRGWMLTAIPLTLVAFLWFRQSQGLPPLDEIYRTRSYIFFVNPIEGLWLNFRWAVSHPIDNVLNVDLWALGSTIGLSIWLVRTSRHQRLPLVAYSLGSILIFVSKVNWAWGSHDTVTYTQSFARYSLALFPLTVLIADKIRQKPKRFYSLIAGLSFAGLLILSAFFTLGGGAP
jgi:hypothetical protein